MVVEILEGDKECKPITASIYVLFLLHLHHHSLTIGGANALNIGPLPAKK